MFILTYDEHGGFFDHVPPPTTDDDDADFRQLGFRVPSIVAGPFAKSGCVVTTEFEHVSILRTLAKRFGLPSLNTRMAAANDLSSCIQPAYFDAPRQAVALPAVPVPFKQIEQRPLDSAHPELRALLDQGLIPPHLDRRPEGLAITKRVLEAGERLGVVKILP